MDNITVRFVPRGRAQVSFSDIAGAPGYALADMVKPTKSQMQKGYAELVARSLPSTGTPQNRLVANMSRKDFDEMFAKPALKEEKATTIEGGRAQRETYWESDQLKVPEALQDTIAFAYVPRPVEYFSTLAIPPREPNYHLTLSDVQLALNARRCHRQGLDGSKIRVAMADSGFFAHPYFIRSGFRLIPTESPGSGPADEDLSGHGTGEAANIFAVAPECTVLGVKQGSSAAGDLETSIDQSPHVMTNSWGFNIDDRDRDALRNQRPNMFFELVDIEQIISEAVEKNIVVLFSAGNGHLAFPASFPDVIAVGGVTVTESGALEASSYASGFKSKLYPGRNVPDVCGIVGRFDPPAPLSAHIMLPVPPDSELDGDNFASGTRGLGWGIFSGTSAACPQAAGVAALLKQINSNLSPSQVKQVLEARSIDIVKGKAATGKKAGPGPDLATGAGLMDALRACGFISGMV